MGVFHNPEMLIAYMYMSGGRKVGKKGGKRGRGSV